jgi:hypothetical protein
MVQMTMQVSAELATRLRPSTQQWTSHSAWNGAVIRPLTPEARVTVRLLRFNDGDRVAAQQRLVNTGLDV